MLKTPLAANNNNSPNIVNPGAAPFNTYSQKHHKAKKFTFSLEEQ
jgi:hypothetical protein